MNTCRMDYIDEPWEIFFGNLSILFIEITHSRKHGIHFDSASFGKWVLVGLKDCSKLLSVLEVDPNDGLRHCQTGFSAS